MDRYGWMCLLIQTVINIFLSSWKTIALYPSSYLTAQSAAHFHATYVCKLYLAYQVSFSSVYDPSERQTSPPLIIYSYKARAWIDLQFHLRWPGQLWRELWSALWVGRPIILWFHSLMKHYIRHRHT